MVAEAGDPARPRQSAIASPSPRTPGLERRGPLAVKIGQYLAGRPDAVPEEHIDELLCLVDLDPPEPWPVVQATIRDDLGASIDDGFEWINPTPELSGALTQVHVGRTRSGEPVTVKVLRPGATDLVRASPALDRLLRGVFADCGVHPVASDELEQDVRTWLLDEVDLERERRNAPRLDRVGGRGARFRFPTAHPELSSHRVFTSSHLRGVRFSDVLPLGPASAQSWRELGIDPGDLADELLEAVLRQVFGLGAFPALIHPSTLVALPDGEIGCLELGAIARIDAAERDHELALVEALRAGDADRLVAAASTALGTSDHHALGRFRADLGGRVRRIFREVEVEGDPGPALALLLREIVTGARQYGIVTSSEALVAHRSLLTADAVARLLDPSSGLGTVSDRFFVRLQVQTVVGQVSLDNLQAVALDVLDLLSNAPGQVGRLLADLAEDRFVLRVATAESDDDRRSGHARARLVSLAVALVALAILVTAPGLDGAVVARVLIGGVLLGAAAAFVVLWSRLR